ncbi:MAG: PQQ-dependent catabolism-associated CXXCW motif protein [Hyphomicrobium sp.]
MSIRAVALTAALCVSWLTTGWLSAGLSMPVAHAADEAIKEVAEPPAAAGAEGAETVNVEEPAGYRTDGYRMPVPRTLAGARVITTIEAEKLYAARSSVFIDVYPRAPKPPNLPAGTLWRDPPHQTMPGAVWLPNVGYGVVTPETEAAFKVQLEKVTGGDRGKTVVFYCLRNCWMSWNAAKRAITYGYTSVVWFPDGNDGWQESGNELESVKPLQ